jgi:hypothetical protein
MKRLFLLFCIYGAAALSAQQSQVAPRAATQAAVTYLFDWPQGIPWTKYSIIVQADGTARFTGTPHPDDSNSDTDPVEQDFTMSGANRERVFELAQKLNYFQGDFDAHIKHIAQTGRKTLEYQSSQVHGSSTFNYSQNADVQELANLFSGIATTVDYGRRLAFQYRFDKLGLDQRLKELVDLQANRESRELHIIAPILRKIANDPNMMNIARQNAAHLLQSIGQAVSAGPTAGQQ